MRLPVVVCVVFLYDYNDTRNHSWSIIIPIAIAIVIVIRKLVYHIFDVCESNERKSPKMWARSFYLYLEFHQSISSTMVGIAAERFGIHQFIRNEYAKRKFSSILDQ